MSFWALKGLSDPNFYLGTAALAGTVSNVYRGIKRKADDIKYGRRDRIRPRLKQDTLKLPAKEAVSNNLMGRGRSMSRGERMGSLSRPRSRRSRTRSRAASRPRMRKQTSIDHRYTGPIPFPSKRPRIQRDRVALQGSRGSLESNFKISEGTDVAYFGVSSLIRQCRQNAVNVNSLPTAGPEYYGVSVPVQVCMAILRKMLKRYYQVDIESPAQTLDDIGLGTNVALQGATNLAPSQLDIYYKVSPASNVSSGSSVRAQYVIGDTLNFMGGGTPVLNKSTRLITIAYAMADKIFNSETYGAIPNLQTPSESRELYGFQFKDRVDTSTSTWTGRGIYRVDTQYIKVSSHTTVYVQNQTVSDSSSNNIDVIDTNPLHGRIYYFSHPNPVVREYRQVNGDSWNNWKLMADANQDGVIYPDSSMKFWDGWNQLPYPDQFMNCKRYATVNLAPGEMKSFKLSFKFNGLLNKLIKGLKILPKFTDEANTGDLNPNEYQYDTSMFSNALGTSVLFAFEKRLSSGSANPTVCVQRNVNCSAVLGGRKKITMLPVRGAELATVADDTTANP